LATEIDKAKDELHTRIEALDAFNSEALTTTVDEIKEEALVNKRHLSDLFDIVKKSKLKERALDKVFTKYSSDLLSARDRIDSLEYEAVFLSELTRTPCTCPQTWQGVHELVA
jgi:hypothetical protein